MIKNNRIHIFIFPPSFMFHYFTSIYSICLVFFLLFYRNTKSSILLAHFTSHYYCNKNTAAAYNAIIPGSPNSAPVPMDKILRLTGAVIPFRIQTMLIPYTIIAQKSSPQQKHQQICRFPYNSDHQTDHTSRCHYVKDHFILSHKKNPSLCNLMLHKERYSFLICS